MIDFPTLIATNQADVFYCRRLSAYGVQR